MKLFIHAILPIAMLAIFCSQPAHAQSLEEGEWRVMIFTPGGEVATAVYEVERIGGSTRATIKWRDGETPAMGLKVDGDLMTFAWDPGFYMECRLKRDAGRQFKGACRDGSEHLGPAVFSPPGVDVTVDDIDIDKAFEIWNVSKEEYVKERYPQPNKTKAPDVAEPEELPSRMVEIDGRRLNLVELGSGDVTVVLESGVGDDHQIWRNVQESLAEQARVVSYDRAGLGRSKPSTHASSPSAAAEELHDLLEAAGYAPPYVLVGHQAGAFTARAYQEIYPGEVHGLVLVDPSHVDEDEHYKTIDAGAWDEYVSRKGTFFSAISKAAAHEFDAYIDALQSNAVGTEASSRGDVPVIVLSGQGTLEKPRWIGERPDGLAAKKALHASLAEELSGELIISSRSAGYIHLEDPDVVVNAVKKILDTIQE